MILPWHEKLSIGSDASNHRKMLMAQFHGQGRRLSSWSIRPYQHGEQRKSGLVYKDDGALFLFGFFLTSSQRCSFQAWIAASSRWLASFLGFCGLDLSSCSRRRQCPG